MKNKQNETYHLYNNITIPPSLKENPSYVVLPVNIHKTIIKMGMGIYNRSINAQQTQKCSNLLVLQYYKFK